MTNLTPEAVKAALDGATPGSWIVDPENVGKSFSWCWQLRTEYGGTPIYVECESRSHRGTNGNEETANLIAMAPDLARDWLRLKKERDELLAALMKIRDRNVPPVDGDSPNVCVHRRTMDQECNLCTAAFASAAVEGK